MTGDRISVLSGLSLAGLDVKPVKHRDSGTMALAMSLYDQQGNQVGRLIMDQAGAQQFLASFNMVLHIVEMANGAQSKTPGGNPGAALN